MDMGLDGRGTEERFAKARNPFICVDAKPQKVWPFSNADGFNGGDLHDSPAVSKARTLSSKCSDIAIVAF